MTRSLWMTLLLVASALPLHAKDPPPPLFVESANQTLPPPPADKAQIVLLEPINKIQGMFPIQIFELQGGQRTLLTVTIWHSKAIVLLDPGKHMLMANGGAAHLMEANVEAGKRYYVLLRFIYAQGMQLRPLRTSGTSVYSVTSPDFPKWQAITTRYVEKTPAADEAFAKDKPNEFLDKAQAKALENWAAHTDAERAELTLHPEDAVQ
jgi:hypothetical protein